MPNIAGFGAESPDRTAMAQMTVSLKALYWDQIPELVAYLAPESTVPDYYRDVNAWPPSWLAIRSGPDLTFVFSGTTNAWQWGSHIYGTFARASFRNNEMNGQWLAVWEALKPEIDAIVDAVPGKVRFSGHSYGGAVAAIAALETGARIGANRVEVMVFGAPRYMTQGYDGDFPPVWWEVSTVGDPVPQTPPDFLLIGSPASWVGSSPLKWSPDSVIWHKPKGRNWLNAIGQNDYDQPPPDPLPRGVRTGIVGVHFLDQYYWRQLEYARGRTNPPAMAGALEAYQRMIGEGVEQVPVPMLPKTVPGPDLSPVVVPWYYGYVEGESLFGGSNMPYPVALTGGEPWTVTLLINQGIQGYSESFTFYVTGGESVGANALRHMESLGASIAADRRKALTERATVVGVRVGRRARGAPSALSDVAWGGAGPGLVTGAAAQESNCYIMRVYDDTGSVRALHYYRGWSQSSFRSTVDGNGKGITPSSEAAAWRTALKNRLVGSHLAYGVTSTGAIPTYQRNPALAVPYDVLEVGFAPSGKLLVTLNGDVSGPWPTNSYMKLAIPRADCVKGVSGTWRVIGTAVNEDGNRQVYIDRRIRCSASSLSGLVGTATPYTQIYVPVGSVVAGGTGDKKCGPPFGATVGRRPSR